jgi:hypothetical protein
MKDHEFKGHSLATLRAPIVRGEQTVAQTARALNCTEKELIAVLARRPLWRAATTNLSVLGKRELHALARTLNTSVGCAVELMLEMIAVSALDAALLNHRA